MCVRSFGVSLDIGFGVSCILDWWGGGGRLFNESLFLIYIATLILTVTVICAETISVDTFITPEESKMGTDGFPFCESNTHGRKEKSPLILYPLPKVFYWGTHYSQPSALKITPSFLLTFLFSFEDWNTHNLLRTVKYGLVLWFPSKEKHLISYPFILSLSMLP